MRDRSVSVPDRIVTCLGFPPHFRLRKSREFDAVFKNNSFRVSSANFLILAMNSDQETNRLGMVVSKKTAGSSVQRNRVKRLIRENFRCSNNLPGLMKSVDMLVITRSGVSDLPAKDIASNLKYLIEQLCKKAGDHSTC